MNEIERILNEYQIEKQKIVSITTDNGANMVKASVDAFGSERYIPCLAHTLNLIVRKSLEDSEVNCLISKLKKIISVFKYSAKANDELQKYSFCW